MIHNFVLIKDHSFSFGGKKFIINYKYIQIIV